MYLQLQLFLWHDMPTEIRDSEGEYNFLVVLVAPETEPRPKQQIMAHTQMIN